MIPKPQDTPETRHTAENECWRLAQSCARWAAETQDRTVRDAFMAMAKEWSRLGLQESTEKNHENVLDGRSAAFMIESLSSPKRH